MCQKRLNHCSIYIRCRILRFASSMSQRIRAYETRIKNTGVAGSTSVECAWIRCRETLSYPDPARFQSRSCWFFSLTSFFLRRRNRALFLCFSVMTPHGAGVSMVAIKREPASPPNKLGEAGSIQRPAPQR